MPNLQHLIQWHTTLFDRLDRALDGWFLGLSARLIFSSVLLVFFLNSAFTKLGDGPFGLFEPSVGAYAQIIPPIAEAVGLRCLPDRLFPMEADRDRGHTRPKSSCPCSFFLASSRAWPRSPLSASSP